MHFSINFVGIRHFTSQLHTDLLLLIGLQPEQNYADNIVQKKA